MECTLCTIVGFLLIPLLIQNASARSDIRGEHISINFYISGENADNAKDILRELLDRFPSDSPLNLTGKLDQLPSHLVTCSNASSIFAIAAENHFNSAKNESANLLAKLRQVPSPEEVTDRIKSQLTDYFSEMENLHVIFSGILDDTVEFILDSMYVLQTTFTQFTDVQNEIIDRRKIQVDEWCHNRYNEFLWQSANETFQCATGKIRIMFDIYSITKMTAYHVLKMLEHRIQKLYNCFLFGNYPIRCRFVGNPEVDFDRLHARLDELLMYNEKQKRKITRNSLGEGMSCSRVSDRPGRGKRNMWEILLHTFVVWKISMILKG